MPRSYPSQKSIIDVVVVISVVVGGGGGGMFVGVIVVVDDGDGGDGVVVVVAVDSDNRGVFGRASRTDLLLRPTCHSSLVSVWNRLCLSSDSSKKCSRSVNSGILAHTFLLPLVYSSSHTFLHFPQTLLDVSLHMIRCEIVEHQFDIPGFQFGVLRICNRYIGSDAFQISSYPNCWCMGNRVYY